MADSWTEASLALLEAVTRNADGKFAGKAGPAAAQPPEAVAAANAPATGESQPGTGTKGDVDTDPEEMRAVTAKRRATPAASTPRGKAKKAAATQVARAAAAKTYAG